MNARVLALAFGTFAVGTSQDGGVRFAKLKDGAVTYREQR